MIYLDHNATTPLDQNVFKAMLPYLTTYFGNTASAHHSFGWEAKNAVEEARAEVARLIGSSRPESIIFTSSATESNNFALKGMYFGLLQPFHLITQKTEHKCVLEAARFLQNLGARVTYLPVTEMGMVTVDELERALTPETKLVSIMSANNEIGTLQNIKEIAACVHKNSQALLHTDAAQAVGHVPVHVENDDSDLMTFSAHKMYGPKGVGALYLGPRVRTAQLMPLLHGGGHEFGLRSGTMNVAAIVGLAQALKIAATKMDKEAARECRLRDEFIGQALEEIPHTTLNGDPRCRLPNNINLSFAGVDSAELMMKLLDLAISSGAACATGTPEPSYVIQALGQSPAHAKSSLRISLGRGTSKSDMDVAFRQIKDAVGELRKNSPAYEMTVAGRD